MKNAEKQGKGVMPRASGSSARWYSILILVVALGLSAYFFFRQSPFVLQSKKRPSNLILISIDTVRTDYLDLYNRNGAPTPALNRIAEKGTVFSDLISQVPFTLPSHCTMLTGTYPMKHLVQENTHDKLSSSAVTLAEVLKSSGYRTGGFVGSIVLDSSVGIGQGFDVYDDVFTISDVHFSGLAGVQKSADEVVRSFRRWFDRKEPGKFFAFVHFYDAHAPYEPPEAFRPLEQTDPNLYKGELSYVDSVIGKMFDDLAKQGVWEDTILVITGDHGEMFGEHKETGHGYYIYQEALKVPLIIVLPGQQKKEVVDSPVQIVDLMPTLLEMLGVPAPKEVQGRSFEPLLEGKAMSHFAFKKRSTVLAFLSRIDAPLHTSAAHMDAYSESLSGAQNFGTAPLRSIQDATFKYIDTARPELYNIIIDPMETRNLVEQEKELAAKMKARLSQVVADYSAGAKEPAGERNLTAEQEEQFAALGYIGTSGSAPEINMNLDAKDYIDFWNDLSEANSLIEDKRYSDAVRVLEKLRNANALPMSAQILVARAYSGLGRYDKAIPALQQILSQDPDNLKALSTVADCYEKAGMIDKAVETYKVLVENNPGSYRSYLLLSGVLEKKGDITGSLKVLEATGGRFQEPDFLFQLGLLYHKAGHPQKEMDTFAKMIELHKEDPRGYFYLGKMLLDRGGPYDKVIELAQRGLDLKPSTDFQVFGNYLMGDALSNLGEKDRAEPYYEKAKQLSQQGETSDEKK
jgi:arylsulfatase A-like enzyme/predicted negative regulator of RcsB-dependent stress response